MPTPAKTLRLGARGSLLSRLQSSSVARALEHAHPGLTVETVIVSTSGDQIQNQPLHAFGGKGLFTKELELALLNNHVDFAVHSFKDVPVTMPLVDISSLAIVSVPLREDPRDVLLSTLAKSITDLPLHAKVGTGSLRRQAQLLALRPDLQILPIRGNIDTRIRKLRDGHFDAVILALAGLKRADLFDDTLMSPIPDDEILPAAGQAALALQCRAADTETTSILQALNDPHTHLAISLERQVIQALSGDCHSPIAALAEIHNAQIHLRANVAARNGHPPLLTAQASAPLTAPTQAVTQVLEKLNHQNVHTHLHGPKQ